MHRANGNPCCISSGFFAEWTLRNAIREYFSNMIDAACVAAKTDITAILRISTPDVDQWVFNAINNANMPEFAVVEANYKDKIISFWNVGNITFEQAMVIGQGDKKDKGLIGNHCIGMKAAAIACLRSHPQIELKLLTREFGVRYSMVDDLGGAPGPRENSRGSVKHYPQMVWHEIPPLPIDGVKIEIRNFTSVEEVKKCFHEDFLILLPRYSAAWNKPTLFIDDRAMDHKLYNKGIFVCTDENHLYGANLNIPVNAQRTYFANARELNKALFLLCQHQIRHGHAREFYTIFKKKTPAASAERNATVSLSNRPVADAFAALFLEDHPNGFPVASHDVRVKAILNLKEIVLSDHMAAILQKSPRIRLLQDRVREVMEDFSSSPSIPKDTYAARNNIDLFALCLGRCGDTTEIILKERRELRVPFVVFNAKYYVNTFMVTSAKVNHFEGCNKRNKCPCVAFALCKSLADFKEDNEFISDLFMALSAEVSRRGSGFRFLSATAQRAADNVSVNGNDDDYDEEDTADVAEAAGAGNAGVPSPFAIVTTSSANSIKLTWTPFLPSATEAVAGASRVTLEYLIFACPSADSNGNEILIRDGSATFDGPNGVIQIDNLQPGTKYKFDIKIGTNTRVPVFAETLPAIAAAAPIAAAPAVAVPINGPNEDPIPREDPVPANANGNGRDYKRELEDAVLIPENDEDVIQVVSCKKMKLVGNYLEKPIYKLRGVRDEDLPNEDIIRKLSAIIPMFR